MRLKVKKLGEATALALLDIGLEKLDEQMGLVKPYNTLTWGRIGLFGAGLVLNALTDKAADYTETLYIAEEPLAIRSIASLVGVIPDAQAVPTRSAIEMRLRHKQPIYPTGGPQGTPYQTVQPAAGLAQFR